MIFKVKKSDKIVQGQLIYDKKEYSLDFKPPQNTDCSIMIGYLYLGVDSESLLVRQIWGYNPYSSWVNKYLKTPYSFPGELVLGKEIEAGTSRRLIEVGKWKTFYDSNTGWICIGNDSNLQDDINVEFATNTIVVLNRKKIKAIWLKPIFENRDEKEGKIGYILPCN